MLAGCQAALLPTPCADAKQGAAGPPPPGPKNRSSPRPSRPDLKAAPSRSNRSCECYNRPKADMKEEQGADNSEEEARLLASAERKLNWRVRGMWAVRTARG